MREKLTRKLIYGLKIILFTSIGIVLLTSCKKSTEYSNDQNNWNKLSEEELAESQQNSMNQSGYSKEQVENSGKDADNQNDFPENPDKQMINQNEDLRIPITEVIKESPSETLINEEGRTIVERFEVPQGFTRQETKKGSFAYYLQNLPLKPAGSKVKYFDGREKSREVYLAVVDFSLGNRDLQQCADAVIRLRAEYLYSMERYNEIHFNFVNGFNAKFSTWSAGNSISVNGNQVTWKANNNNNGSYESFQKYLDIVYAYASTLSLEKELTEKAFEDLTIGDVLIQGGSPGHCVIIMDMAVNENTGEKVFMLAQSYMPAQDIQILKGNSEDSPWYSAEIEDIISTPEWSFKRSDLKTW